MSKSKPSIILVHLGTDIPLYLDACLKQIRLWNSVENVAVYLVAFEELYEILNPLCEKYSITFVRTSMLTPTENHSRFIRYLKNYDASFRNNYWRYVVERFFYMEEVMRAYNLSNVIHMEYDVMLYMDVSEFYPGVVTNIPGMALAFDNDTQGYPSFIFINSIGALELLNGFITVNCNSGLTDMKLLSVFRWLYPNLLQSLPQIPVRPTENRTTLSGTVSNEPPIYLANLFTELGCRIFDSIAIGQLIGGIDARNAEGAQVVEYENESAFYKVSEFGVRWNRCGLGRWFPETNAGQRIVNIHIHSKKLSYFLSDRADEPKCDYKDTPLYRIERPSIKKIAFCFLIYDKINHEELWNHFFKNVDKNKYTIYIHYKTNAPLKYFEQYKVQNCIETNYGDCTVTLAHNILFREAYKDKDNYKFMTLSGACIPLKSFDHIYNKLTQDSFGYFNACPSSQCFPNCLSMLDFIEGEKIRKSHNWFILNRLLLEKLCMDKDEIIKNIYKRVLFPEEYYYYTFICLQNLENEIITTPNLAVGPTTFTNWEGMDYKYVHNYGLKNYSYISQEELLYLLNSKSLFGRKFNVECNLLDNKEYINFIKSG